MRTFRITLASILLLIGIYCLGSFITEANDQQVRKSALAELKHIQYDLFNPEAWKEKIADILTKKITELDLSGNNRTVLKEQIEATLYTILDEVNKIMHAREDNSLWGMVKQVGRSFVADVVIDIQGLRSKVPELAEAVLTELDQPENRELIRSFLLNKINEAIDQQFGRVDIQPLISICDAYGHEYPCDQELRIAVSNNAEKLWSMAVLMVVLATVVFLTLIKASGNVHKILITLGVAMCVALLIPGVSTPMIDIDARISHFEFEALGETVTFGEQVLFFQSKSITDVVQLLVDSRSSDSIGAGVLIFLFSIIFPVGKIISSLLLLWIPSFRTNSFLSFFAFRSGKWSMADVMVVAIFMAFIGFRGLINHQLQNMTGQLNSVELFTTNNTTLQPGFILFVAFCLFSILLSGSVQRYIHSNQHSN